MNAILGIYNLSTYGGSIFKSLSPWYVVNFFKNNGHHGWLMLGGVILCITGAEAMYSDLGHFNRQAISVGGCGGIYKVTSVRKPTKIPVCWLLDLQCMQAAEGQEIIVKQTIACWEKLSHAICAERTMYLRYQDSGQMLLLETCICHRTAWHPSALSYDACLCYQLEALTVCGH